MKTKTKLLFTIGLVAALCIGFLVGISVNFPKVDNSDLAGTFGKAEKFHKVQMTAKDIQLRSELLKDTAQLRSVIQVIVYFSIFTEDVCKEIDLTLTSFKEKGLGSQTGESEAVKALQDYSDFIRNNNKTLSSTITLLTGFYMKDTVNLTQDVEKNLKDFGSYVNGLNQKNMVLSQALKSIDNFMLPGKTLQANTTELTQLKSIRDQLLIKGLQLGGLIGSKEQVVSMIECAVGANAVSAMNSKGNFDATDNALAIRGCFGSKDLTGTVVSYNPSLLEFSVYAANAKGSAHSAIEPIAFLGKQTLDVLLADFPLLHVYQSQTGSGNLTFNAISHIFAGSGQNAFQSPDGLGNIISPLGTYSLGSGPPYIFL